MTDQGSLVS